MVSFVFVIYQKTDLMSCHIIRDISDFCIPYRICYGELKIPLSDKAIINLKLDLPRSGLATYIYAGHPHLFLHFFLNRRTYGF